MHGELRTFAPELKEDPTIKKGDHGVIAASHLYQSLLRNDDNLAQKYLPAIRAIGFHNTKYPAVNAARDPVAALLILCDTVQDWGRSQLGYDRSATVILSRLVSSAGTPSEEQFGPVRAFAFSTLPQPEQARVPEMVAGRPPQPTPGWKPAEHVWAKVDGKPQFKITLDYGVRIRDGSSIFFNWADSTFNLRRVDFRPWGLDLRICHRLPFDQGAGISKMNELAQFVNREELGFMEPWVRVASEQDESQALCHRIVPAGNQTWETLTFNLCPLSEAFANGKRLIFGTLDAFERAIREMPSSKEQAAKEPKQRPPIVLKKADTKNKPSYP